MIWFFFGKNRPTRTLGRMSRMQREWHMNYRERFVG